MDIVFSSATRLATAIRAREVSAVEVLAAHLAQIDRHNPALNAVVTLDADGARKRAREADAALARGDVLGPLHGVPFTLKDAHAMAGMRTTTGFPPLDHVPAEDGTVATRLKAAGGILIGKTNGAEMLGDPGQSGNPIFGRTNNPWSAGRTPGGSSGGAAAAVASGMTPFEIGTDLAGSIRIPAHFCGLFGLKPTEHRVSLHGLIPGLPPPRSVRVMSCVGPLGRTVEDLTLLDGIIAGPDGRDTDVPPVPIVDPPVLDPATLRIAVASTFPGLPVAAEIRDAVEALATRLVPVCAAVDRPDLPALDFDPELLGMIVGASKADADEPPATLPHYLEALDRRDRAIVAWDRFFDDWDALICPPAMVTAFLHRESGVPLPVEGRHVDYWQVGAHAAPFNYTGHPAAVLPFRLDRDGLPIGVQAVGKRWDDARLLGIARVLTTVTGDVRRPPGC